MKVGEILGNAILSEGVDTKLLTFKLFISLAIVLVGIIIGKLTTMGLKKLSEKMGLEKKVKKNLIDLCFTIIRWSIYLIFLTFGLNYLNVSNLTQNIANALLIIPTFVGALVLIFFGFSIAYFLKKIIITTEVSGAQIISDIIFYFVVYISGVYAVKTALISIGEQLTDYLIMILTATFAGAVAYVLVKKSSK